VVEICLELKPFFRNFRKVLERGYVIFIDYGDRATNLYSYRHRNGNLRSYYQQEQIHDPFFAVGQQDLTADVDFTAALSSAEEADFKGSGPIQQGTWLRNVGIQSYIESAGNRQSAQKELDLLTRPAGLGSAFDVLIFKTPDLPDGPGLHQRHQY
jgi:SAM-dependent MidA family methyltransferase